MKVLEPTLIIASSVITPNNGGATTEIDFDFGNLEGALLLGVDYYLQRIGTTGEVYAALSLDPDRVAPAGNTELLTSTLCIAHIKVDEALTTSGAYSVVDPHYDLRPYDIVIARNIALQGFEVSGNNRAVAAKLYYKRVQFTQSEVGPVITFRR